MQNNKFIRLISHFSKAEISDFRLFVQSPYFNKNQKLVKVLEYIQKFYPDFDQQNFTRENTFDVIFPGEQFDFPKLTKLLSKLFKLAEQFISHNYIKTNTNERELLLLEYYQNNNLTPFFSSTLQQVEKKYTNNFPIQNEQWLLDSYRMEFKRTEFLSKQPDGRKGDINFPSYL